MIYLLLRILFTVAFSHLLRFSQARCRRPMGAAAVNYGVATAACLGWAALAGVPRHPHSLVLGGLAGFTYVTSLVMILPSMRRSGVSVTGAVVQLSMMLPVAVAIWRFREYPSASQYAGIACTLVALPLLSAARAVAVDPSIPTRGLSWLTLLLFVSTGASQVLMKEFTVTCPRQDLPLYSAALFAAATLCTLLWMSLAGDSGRPAGEALDVLARPASEWAIGTLLGTVNLLQLVFLLLALRALPAVIVFPVSAALGILVNALASLVFWRERPPAAGWTGIALAVAAVVLLNLR